MTKHLRPGAAGPPPSGRHPSASAARVWRRIGVGGEISEGRGLLSMHRRPAGREFTGRELTWQHLDRADESGVRSFISITGFAYGEELLDAALQGPRRARIVEHGDATSFAFLAARRTAGAARDTVAVEPLAILIADDYLLTIGAAGAIDFDAAARRIKHLATGVRAMRAVVLLVLLEQVVANLAECADELMAQLNQLEETIFANPPDGVPGSAAIYQYKRELMTLKRAVIPLQQPLATVIADQSADVGDDARRHLTAVGNDLAQVVERVLYCDDAATSMLQANLTQIDVTQNSDMRRIAAVGAILAGWGILAGIYQMTEDFEQLHRTHGVAMFWSTIAAATVVSVLLCVLFRRIRWL